MEQHRANERFWAKINKAKVVSDYKKAKKDYDKVCGDDKTNSDGYPITSERG